MGTPGIRCDAWTALSKTPASSNAAMTSMVMRCANFNGRVNGTGGSFTSEP
jgi:hypothetical protein